MIFGGRSLNDLSIDDFRALIENRVSEGPNLEYKRTVYGSNDDARRELLKDISALANADGGYLVIGIEDDGADRAASLAPIDDPHVHLQKMRQSCLDSINERIDGFEMRTYETGFNQGIIVVYVPPSQKRPHMVTIGKYMQFWRRYDTDTRLMTLGEIRDSILGNPMYRRVVELELQTRGQLQAGGSTNVAGGPSPIEVLTERPVERFLSQYLKGTRNVQTLLIISPFIGDLAGTQFELKTLLREAMIDRTPIYVITQPPRDSYQERAMDLLQQAPTVEIRYNPDLHAKLYICWTKEESQSFAMLGSGNLTQRGLQHNIELGMMIFARGYGRTLLRELYDWGHKTRIAAGSKRVKPINLAQERGGHSGKV